MVQKNKVVVRCLDGRTLKGVTLDFLPNKEVFHLADAADERKMTRVATADLKAVFFVQSFEGNSRRKDGNVPASFSTAPGRKLRVTFLDGETLVGTTNAYTPGRQGFFMLPADPDENNERVYVFTHATRDVLPAETTMEPSAAAPSGWPQHGAR